MINRFGESDPSKTGENVEIPGLGGGVDVTNAPPMLDEPNYDDDQVRAEMLSHRSCERHQISGGGMIQTVCYSSLSKS